MKLDNFTDSYISSIFLTEMRAWLSVKSTEDDLSEETLRRIVEDCQKFQDENWEDIKDNLVEAGYDFWMTRNRHGVGFWDGEWPEEVGERLTESAHKYGEFSIYRGDDGKIHHLR